MAERSMVRGDTLIFDLEFDQADGSPQSLAGCTLYFTARRYRGDTTAVISLTNGSGITVTDAANGRAYAEITPAMTSGLTAWTQLVYDVELTDASGRVYTLEEGTLVVSLDVTVPAP